MRGEALRGMKKRMKHVHPLVANTAIDIIMESYDALMQNNVHYRVFREGCAVLLGHEGSAKELEQCYLEHNWGKGVEAARHTLAALLAPGASTSLDEDAKMRIHEALVLDKSLQMGRSGRDAWTAAGVRRQ